MGGRPAAAFCAMAGSGAHAAGAATARALVVAILVGPALGGCEGVQSALDPRGPVAADIARLWWVLLSGLGGVYLLTLGLLFYAVYRRHDRRVPLREGAFVVVGGLVLPTVALIAILVYSTGIGRSIVAEPDTPALQIEVTAHQWWWEVRYPPVGDWPEAITANELHLPVGVPVEVTLSSADVIHSFWIPSLAGKLDAIPGRVSIARLMADREATLRGQCAEFCGAQHARMAFRVVTEPPGVFGAWRRAQAADALGPAAGDPAAIAGRQAFIDHDCAQCHRIRGDIPGSGRGDRLTGIRGPDLTHLASRSAIGGRTLPYSRHDVQRWIVANQALKPGNRMPDFSELPADTAESIAAYLDSLR